MADKPPLAPRLKDPRRPEDQKPICRQFLWGKCTKFADCKYRHELDIPEMKKTVKFCRNFQNRVGCDGKDCTYLHTSKDEQRLFFETGQLPIVLLERHAALAALADSANITRFTSPAGTQPKSQGYQQPSRLTLSPASVLMPPPPPPPPPPKETVSQNYIPPIMVQPPPPPPQETISPSYVQPIIAQPPPPPPLPASSQFLKCLQVSEQIRELPREFDASRPPPAINQQFSPTTGCKRKWPQWRIEAGTSKTAKAAEPDNLCENCIELDKRTLKLKSEIDKNFDKESNLKFILSKKAEEYESKRKALFALIGPEQQKAVSALIEATGTATVPTQSFLQLMECMLNNNAIRPSSSYRSIINMEDNRISGLTQPTSTNSFLSQPIETNNDFPSISHVLSSATHLMKSSSSDEIERELRDIVRNLNIPRQETRQNIQVTSSELGRFFNNYTNLESLIRSNEVLGYDRGGAVAPLRLATPSVSFSAFQPTVPPPNPSHPQTTYSQTPNVVMQQPAVAAPSPQMNSSTDGVTTQNVSQSSYYNGYGSGRYNIVNYNVKQYP